MNHYTMGVKPFHMPPSDMSCPMLREELDATLKGIRAYQSGYTDRNKKDYFESLYPWRNALNAELRARETKRKEK